MNPFPKGAEITSSAGEEDTTEGGGTWASHQAGLAQLGSPEKVEGAFLGGGAGEVFLGRCLARVASGEKDSAISTCSYQLGAHFVKT